MHQVVKLCKLKIGEEDLVGLRGCGSRILTALVLQCPDPSVTQLLTLLGAHANLISRIQLSIHRIELSCLLVTEFGSSYQILKSLIVSYLISARMHQKQPQMLWYQQLLHNGKSSLNLLTT